MRRSAWLSFDKDVAERRIDDRFKISETLIDIVESRPATEHTYQFEGPRL